MHLKAQETTLEKMADPVSERPSSRRHRSRPQLWQVSLGEQRATNTAKAGAELFSFSLAEAPKSYIHFHSWLKETEVLC